MLQQASLAAPFYPELRQATPGPKGPRRTTPVAMGGWPAPSCSVRGLRCAALRCSIPLGALNGSYATLRSNSPSYLIAVGGLLSTLIRTSLRTGLPLLQESTQVRRTAGTRMAACVPARWTSRGNAMDTRRRANPHAPVSLGCLVKVPPSTTIRCGPPHTVRSPPTHTRSRYCR
jgi:hypothetical protein